MESKRDVVTLLEGSFATIGIESTKFALFYWLGATKIRGRGKSLAIYGKHEEETKLYRK